MSSHKEVREWTKSLTEELNEIPNFLTNLERASSIDSFLKEKLKNLTKLLQKSIEKFLIKCENLQKKAVLTDAMLSSGKSEYFRLMQNIDNFYNTLRLSNLKPNYVQSTFVSRYRSNSCKKQRKALQQKSESAKFLQPKKNEVFFSKKLNVVVSKINSHVHKNYSKKLDRLEKSNSNFRTKIVFLQEETNENMHLAQNLLDRLGFLE